LLGDWAVDTAAMVGALHPYTGEARLFLAGACADDLAGPAGPLELVALTAQVPGAPEVAEPLRHHPRVSTMVPVDLLVVPLAMLRAWSARLVGLLLEPACRPAPMPLPVAAGLHALHAQRELAGGHLFTAELETAHTELLPLYLAAQAQYQLLDLGRDAPPAQRLVLLLRSLLGAWGLGNPHDCVLARLFDRAARRLALPVHVPPAVRQALAGALRPADLESLVDDLDRLRAAEPILRVVAPTPAASGRW
jgi:hypothetical protein